MKNVAFEFNEKKCIIQYMVLEQLPNHKEVKKNKAGFSILQFMLK